MSRSQVNELLARDTANRARYKHITLLMKRLKSEIFELETNAADISASRLSDMPPSHVLRDDTADKAVALVDGELRSVRALRDQLEKLENERLSIRFEIECVNNWLSVLNERERLVIRHKLIDGRSWSLVASSYEDSIGRYACETTLRHIKAKALKKICTVAG